MDNQALATVVSLSVLVTYPMSLLSLPRNPQIKVVVGLLDIMEGHYGEEFQFQIVPV